MNEARPFASLSSGLLARKGAAKPAMRPQGFGPHGGFEDLGWNDMGHEPAADDGFEDELPEHVPSSISALTPAPKLPKGEEPEVIAQQRAIAESFPPEPEGEAEPEAEPEAPQPRLRRAEVVPLPMRPVPAAAPGRKAAFTLRLDAERHLRLRLAAAVTGRSAQQILIGALDAMLESIPEVEAMAERVPPAKAKRS
ncbi:MAG: hypothetical protein QOJ53_156 [Sphingomonadales bacterium]|nr:hypothetical protein [Sphingomonadales bacterium]